MVLPDDSTLLREWSARRSEAAFRTLVERYAGLVHGTALRQLRRVDWAAEAAQDAFVLLTRWADEQSPPDGESTPRGPELDAALDARTGS